MLNLSEHPGFVLTQSLVFYVGLFLVVRCYHDVFSLSPTVGLNYPFVYFAYVSDIGFFSVKIQTFIDVIFHVE